MTEDFPVRVAVVEEPYVNRDFVGDGYFEGYDRNLVVFSEDYNDSYANELAGLHYNPDTAFLEAAFRIKDKTQVLHVPRRAIVWMEEEISDGAEYA